MHFTTLICGTLHIGFSPRVIIRK